MTAINAAMPGQSVSLTDVRAVSAGAESVGAVGDMLRWVRGTLTLRLAQQQVVQRQRIEAVGPKAGAGAGAEACRMTGSLL